MQKSCNSLNLLHFPIAVGDNLTCGKVSARMAPPNAAERVRRRIAEWTKRQGHGSKKTLAHAVKAKFGTKKSASWATGLTKPDGSDLRLRDLDDVAQLLDVPPGDLVRRDTDHYLEVTPSEMRLLRHFRMVPDVIRGHWMAYLDYIFGPHEQAFAEQATERDRRTAEARADQLARKKA